MKFPLHHFPDAEHLDHPSQAKIGIHPFPDRLYVVTMLENPLRWRARYDNYWKFEKHVHDSGAILYTVEIAYGDRKFEITEPGNPQHIQLRTYDEVWHKENALNIAISHLPTDAKYVAWVDADVTFQRPDWAQETLHLLQHYDFIQMFSHAHDIERNHCIMNTHTGFVYQYEQEHLFPAVEHVVNPKGPMPRFPDLANYPYSGGGGGSFNYWHPGFAWAAKISALEKVGMLIDWAVLGSADWHMAWALIGQPDKSIDHKDISNVYAQWTLEWCKRCDEHIKQNVGYMPGAVYHAYHGTKEKRRYYDRWRFLINAKFDPSTDLKKDRQGLWQLSGNNKVLRDGIRMYNRTRNEDE